MEQFKMKVKRRITLLSVGTLGIVVFCVYGFFAMASRTMEDGTFAEFQLGLLFGIGVRAIIEIVKLSMVMKDNKKLKMLYNKENDERLKLIRSKSGMPMLMITSTLMLIAAVISGYFNTVVFLTLIIAATVQLLIGVIVKLYCMKAM
ncbi:MAG: hypothetical protein WDA24_10410 [Tissierellales bacterium]